MFIDPFGDPKHQTEKDLYIKNAIFDFSDVADADEFNTCHTQPVLKSLIGKVSLYLSLPNLIYILIQSFSK